MYWFWPCNSIFWLSDYKSGLRYVCVRLKRTVSLRINEFQYKHLSWWQLQWHSNPRLQRDWCLKPGEIIFGRKLSNNVPQAPEKLVSSYVVKQHVKDTDDRVKAMQKYYADRRHAARKKPVIQPDDRTRLHRAFRFFIASH